VQAGTVLAAGLAGPQIYSARTHSLGLRLTIKELLIVGAIVEIYDKDLF
jgi:hypothetical protein